MAYAVRKGATLEEDALVMRLLTHETNQVCAKTVAGLGPARVHESVAASEAAGRWWDAARLWFAVSTTHGQGAGNDLKRAWAALDHVSETESSRELETRILNFLNLNSSGYAFGTPEHNRLCARLQQLKVQARDASTDTQSASKFEMFLGVVNADFVPAFESYGVSTYQPHMTAERLVRWNASMQEMGFWLRKMALVAPDAARRSIAASTASFFTMFCSLGNWEPSYDSDKILVRGAAGVREEIDTYSFDVVHKAAKNGNFGFDSFMFGCNEAAMLLLYGDLSWARKGWAKQIDAWKRIHASVKSGDSFWGDYAVYEEIVSVCTVRAFGPRAIPGLPPTSLLLCLQCATRARTC